MTNGMIKINVYTQETPGCGWTAWSEKKVGIVASGATEKEALKEFKISLVLKFAYENGMNLDSFNLDQFTETDSKEGVSFDVGLEQLKAFA